MLGPQARQSTAGPPLQPTKRPIVTQLVATHYVHHLHRDEVFDDKMNLS